VARGFGAGRQESERAVKRLISALLLFVVLGGAGWWHDAQSASSFLDQKSIVIDHAEQPVRPEASLVKIGCTLRHVPDKDNAAVLYTKASNISRKPEGRTWDLFFDVARSTWVEDPEFEQWFDGEAECLKLIHQAVAKPDCEFPVFGHDDDPAYDVILPHLGMMRAFARYLACEGKRYEHNGDVRQAIESYLAIGTLAEHVRSPWPVCIVDLTSFACHGIEDRAIELCLANADVPAEDLRTIIRTYRQGIERLPTFAGMLKYEMYNQNSFVKEILDNPATARRLFRPRSGPIRTIWLASMIRRNTDRMKQDYERSRAALEEWAAKPAWEALRGETDFRRQLQGPIEERFLSRELLGPLSMAKLHYARILADERGIMLFAAIKLYEKEKGTPPASLDDLVPGFVPELPVDPFSGNGFVYRRSDGGWVLYSVWDNCLDDGGAGRMPHSTEHDLDWVYWSKPIAVEAPQAKSPADAEAPGGAP
jgi:hypothetical protein